MTQKRIAEAFSNGNFELTYPYLAEQVEWIVVGKSCFKGKQAVIDNCEQAIGYFKSVKTNFKTINVIAYDNRVAINGTAEFIRGNQRVNFISACDVYEFNDNHELQRITSYCIQKR